MVFTHECTIIGLFLDRAYFDSMTLHIYHDRNRWIGYFDVCAMIVYYAIFSNSLPAHNSPETWTVFEAKYKSMSNGYHRTAGLDQADKETDEDYFKKHGGLRVVAIFSPPWGIFKDDDHDVRLNPDEIKVGEQ